MNRQILQGNASDKLKEIENDSVDLMVTDPPYGYSFMNKSWDKAIVSVDTWKECLRVLKPGAFAFVMSAPRQDVLSHMIANLAEAGFVTNFTSVYWAYASGFPKAANISKLVDKKLGKERKIVGTKQHSKNFDNAMENKTGYLQDTANQNNTKCFGYGEEQITEPSSEQAKKLNGSYGGFQPKPAVEVILVCMKPLSEKSFTEQAMKNGKGITWLDDCRITTTDEISNIESHYSQRVTQITSDITPAYSQNDKGRFPANLLVSDDAINDDKVRKASKTHSDHGLTDKGFFYEGNTYDDKTIRGYADEGSFSRYFDLDRWNAQFVITPKPSKSEKEKGLDKFTKKQVNDGREIPPDNAFQRGKTERKNTHPTVKPVSLMKYLITLGSRENDLVLDPFLGSGTTAIACEMISRKWIGIELLKEHADIARGRLHDYLNQQKMEAFV